MGLAASGNILTEIFRECGIEKDFESYLVLKSFQRIVGDIIFCQCSKVRFENHLLWLKIESPVFRQEVMIYKEMIIQKYNKEFKKKIIQDIKFY